MSRAGRRVGEQRDRGARPQVPQRRRDAAQGPCRAPAARKGPAGLCVRGRCVPGWRCGRQTASAAAFGAPHFRPSWALTPLLPWTGGGCRAGLRSAGLCGCCKGQRRWARSASESPAEGSGCFQSLPGSESLQGPLKRLGRSASPSPTSATSAPRAPRARVCIQIFGSVRSQLRRGPLGRLVCCDSRARVHTRTHSATRAPGAPPRRLAARPCPGRTRSAPRGGPGPGRGCRTRMMPRPRQAQIRLGWGVGGACRSGGRGSGRRRGG